MLACLDSLLQHEPRLEFVAIAPDVGPLAEELTQRGIEVLPWQLGGDPTSRLTREQLQSHLLELVRRASPNLLHANSLAMGRLTGSVADRLAIPMSSHLRDIIHVSATAMADLNHNRRLIAVSQATRDAHVARGMEPDRVVVVRNGIDLEQFKLRSRQGWLRHELALPDSAVLLATIGQIGLRKGQDILAEAAPAIVRAVPDVHFLILGSRSSTKAESIEFEQAIHRRFAEHGLTSHLHCIGYRDDVATLLTELDLVVHPANQEPYGRVLLEAAASGVPVVATDVGGTAEIVIDGMTGRLVPPRDPARLATAVIGLLQDRGLMQSMSIAGRERAISEFEISRSSRRLAEEWKNVLAANETRIKN
ncbi:MAG: glycosyltransferase family 1 protein [Schlesneria sp.]|nr:glycosyltransferase family 1 protein [Schlesneria sp.]